MSKRVNNEYDVMATNGRDRYFGAVIDVKSFFGTRNEIAVASTGNESCEYRYFNDKFVDTPQKALAVACDIFNKRHSIPMDEIMKGVHYDAENNEYVIHVMLTSNQNKPTERQMERWLNGEPGFRLYDEEYRIQVYETTLTKGNLINGAKRVEFQLGRKR